MFSVGIELLQSPEQLFVLQLRDGGLGNTGEWGGQKNLLSEL